MTELEPCQLTPTVNNNIMRQIACGQILVKYSDPVDSLPVKDFRGTKQSLCSETPTCHGIALTKKHKGIIIHYEGRHSCDWEHYDARLIGANDRRSHFIDLDLRS